MRIISGTYSGLKAKIKELEENAKYANRVAHNLYLVLNDAVKGVPPKVTDFVVVIDCILNFFNMSVRRRSVLLDNDISSQNIKRCNAKNGGKKGKMKHVAAVGLTLTYVGSYKRSVTAINVDMHMSVGIINLTRAEVRQRENLPGNTAEACEQS